MRVRRSRRRRRRGGGEEEEEEEEEEGRCLGGPVGRPQNECASGRPPSRLPLHLLSAAIRPFIPRLPGPGRPYRLVAQ
jgi:hypothetical protein